MAAASNYMYDYIAGQSIIAGSVITSANALAIPSVAAYLVTYPTAKLAMQLLTDNVKISINASDSVTFMRGDMAYISSGKTWLFGNDCEVAIMATINMV